MDRNIDADSYRYNYKYMCRYIPNSNLTVASLERGVCFLSPSASMPSLWILLSKWMNE